ncbi:hypothetical protein [Ammoniphilus resinae]|uniref:Uncharacterized protein n=1 Tax=Ammoniphilus resinae TaxID=861532 RepID=A0ABS4GMI7_9BACL|nr:hypothetical protein [Ammoniphilus resinae]MBP1931488.1 hypothetical protein [Ammoniphilus resinae]
MGFFWFAIGSILLFSLLSFLLHSRKQPEKNQPTTNRLIFTAPVEQKDGVYIRNLRTNVSVFIPAQTQEKQPVSAAWIASVIGASIGLGCLSGYGLYKIWELF